MNISTAVIIITFVLIIAVPLFLVVKQGTNSTKKLKKTFRRLAEENSLHLDLIELTPNLLLGFDRVSKKFLYAPHDNPETGYHIIDLTKVKEIALIAPEDEEQAIEKIAITFDNNPAQTVVFYDDLTSMGADGTVCKYIAEKWIGLLGQV